MCVEREPSGYEAPWQRAEIRGDTAAIEERMPDEAIAVRKSARDIPPGVYSTRTGSLSGERATDGGDHAALIRDGLDGQGDPDGSHHLVVVVDARDEGNRERDDVPVVEEKSLVLGPARVPAVDEDVARVVDANRARLESGHRPEIDDLSAAEQGRMGRCACREDIPCDTATTVDGPRAAVTVASHVAIRQRFAFEREKGGCRW